MDKRSVVLSVILFLLFIQPGYSGPPFITDDPQPVDFRHWEYYISSTNIFQSGTGTGTLPHFEVNYGLLPDVQIHLLLPMNYIYSSNERINLGYAYTEFGMKYRFLQESESRPQIGVFPIVELPTLKNTEFSNGKVQIYLPVWVQKSWGKLTTYGGAGYWINPGTNNKDWMYSGWELQYDLSKHFTFGGEIYNHSASTSDSKSVTGFNVGGFVNFTEKFHFIFSMGHSLANERFISSYVGLLWTI